MIVFKAFLRVLDRNKWIVILYTVILIAFSGFHFKTNDHSMDFTVSKPDVLIINDDEDIGFTHSLITYIEKNSTIVDVKNEGNAIDDALFYRNVNYIIYIPKHYRRDFLTGKNPQIQVKSTGDYQASFAAMMLDEYLKLADIYRLVIDDENLLIMKMEESFSKRVDVEMTSTLDSNLSLVSYYYNFASYSFLAGCVYVICMILSSFQNTKIQMRTFISSMNYRSYTWKLLCSNGLFAFLLWLFYVVLSFILIGDIMFSFHGCLFILNSFVFMSCTLAIAFLIGNVVQDKNAINGVVNIVALGSSFLCGVFVPMQWLPDFVLKIAHILPSYYYIANNEGITMMESFDFKTLQPYFMNLFILILFMIGFVFFTNWITFRRRSQHS